MVRKSLGRRVVKTERDGYGLRCAGIISWLDIGVDGGATMRDASRYCGDEGKPWRMNSERVYIREDMD